MSRDGMYVCAELGVSWMGLPKVLMKTVKTLVSSGVDAIKVQFFDSKVLENYPAKLRTLLEPMILDLDDVHDISKICRKGNSSKHVTDLVVTPFSQACLDRLIELPAEDIWAYKIRSPDWKNEALIKKAKDTGKHVYVSVPYVNGVIHSTPSMGSMKDNDAFFGTRSNEKMHRIYCVPKYPPETKDLHLHNFVGNNIFDGCSIHSNALEDHYACACFNIAAQYVTGRKRQFYIEVHTLPCARDMYGLPKVEILDKEVALPCMDVMRLQKLCNRLEESIG